jgi:hypothetical protein
MMNDRNNNEWLDDYKTLKQINSNNPFTVPAGYFDELGRHIESRIRLDELKNKMLLNGFTVPENYFEQLGGNIQSRINIESALSAEETGFTVPENYFEQLNSRLTGRVLVEDALINAGDFTVPENYFTQLNQNILNKTANREIAKRRGVVRRLVSSTAFKYATAACLVLTVGTGIFLNRVSSPGIAHNRTFLHQQLSSVPVDEIQDYLQLNVDANDTQHIVADEGLPVNDAALNNALQNYTNTQE